MEKTGLYDQGYGRDDHRGVIFNSKIYIADFGPLHRACSEKWALPNFGPFPILQLYTFDATQIHKWCLQAHKFLSPQ